MLLSWYEPYNLAQKPINQCFELLHTVFQAGIDEVEVI